MTTVAAAAKGASGPTKWGVDDWYVALAVQHGEPHAVAAVIDLIASAPPVEQLKTPKAKSAAKSRKSREDEDEDDDDDDDDEDHEEPDDRVVVVSSRRLHRTVDAAIGALVRTAITQTPLYQRDGRLVRVTRIAQPEAEHEGMAAGTPRISRVSKATLVEVLTSVAKFVPEKKKKKKGAKSGKKTEG